MPNYYGRKPDHHDTRDRILRFPQHLVQAIPPSADVLTGLNLPVLDQGSEGSCTANSGVLYRRWLYQRFSKTSQADHDLSRQFLYYQERALPWNNSVNEDSGAAMRDICVVLANVGVCPEIDYPYTANFTDAPTPQAIVDAADRKVGAYHRLPDLETVKCCLSTGPAAYPVLIGFPVFQSFESIGSDGMMPMPEKNESQIGGHAVVCHGFDDGRAALSIQNSWGADWGAAGHFYMPYEFFNKYITQIDCWMMHLGKIWK